MEDQIVIDDALELCTAVLNKLDVGMVLIAREAGRISELGRVDYIYNNFKTPYLLQREGLATIYIIDLPNIPKGSFRAVFDLDKVQEWISKKLDMQPETAEEVWKQASALPMIPCIFLLLAGALSQLKTYLLVRRQIKGHCLLG